MSEIYAVQLSKLDFKVYTFVAIKRMVLLRISTETDSEKHCPTKQTDLYQSVYFCHYKADSFTPSFFANRVKHAVQLSKLGFVQSVYFRHYKADNFSNT